MQKSNNLPSIMQYNDQISDNMRGTADLFANFFESVHANTSNSHNFQCNNQCNCNNHMELTDNKIIQIINSLNRNKVNSLDGIPIIF